MPVGPYDLCRPIGRGGMATVYEAIHRSLGSTVALKVTRPNPRIDTRVLDPFLHEVRSMASLDHPGIVRVHDFGWVDAGEWLPGPHEVGTPTTWLAMDLFVGGTLSDLRYAPSLDWPTIRQVLRELLDALAYSHSWGLVHRDVKPANVLLRRDHAPIGAVVLSDFGLAHAGAERDQEGVTEKACGTPRFMAPEQLRGRWRDYGPWTDIYALGWLAWELAQRGSPVAGLKLDDLYKVHVGYRPAFAPVVDVPEALEDWINVAIAVHPEDRFQSAAEAARALSLVDDAAAALPTSAPADWRREADQRRALPGTGIGLLPLRQAPTTGREAERDILWNALLQAVDRREGRLVVLSGESGVGKSHLASWLLRRVEEHGVGLVVSARHAAQPGPTDGVVGLLLRLLVCRGLDRDALRWRLESLSEALPQETRYDRLGLVELMSPSPDLSQGEDERVDLSSADERQRLVARVLLRRARRKPLIVHIDDAQWGPETLGVVAHLLDADAPVLVVLSLRRSATAASAAASAAVARLLQRSGARELPVGPLPAAEQRALLLRLVPLDEGLAGRLIERSGGNPLFALQLLRDQAERALLEARGGVFSLRSDARDALPSTIRDLWTQRLDTALGPDRVRRRALWLAAALGQDVDGDEWHAACLIADVVPEQGALDALVDAGLIRVDAPRPGTSWSFGHHLLREALLAEATAARWVTTAHAACYQALRQAGFSRSERLAPHAEGLGRPLEAFDLWYAAGVAALERGELGVLENAIAGTRRCLALAEVPATDERQLKPELLRMRRLRFGGSPAEGMALGTSLLERATALNWTSDRGRLLFELGFSAVLEGVLEQGDAWLNEALLWCVEDEAGHRQVRAGVFRILGTACKHRGRLHDALEYFDEAERHAGADAAPRFGMALKVDRGAIYSLMGEHARARELLLAARLTCADLGLRYTEMQVVENLVHLCIVEGALADAMSYCEEALDVNREIGSSWADDLDLLRIVIFVAQSMFEPADVLLQRIESGERARFGRGEELDLQVARLVTDLGLGRAVRPQRLDDILGELAALGRVLALYGRCFVIGGEVAGDPALARRMYRAAIAQFEGLGDADAAAGVRARLEALPG